LESVYPPQNAKTASQSFREAVPFNGCLYAQTGLGLTAIDAEGYVMWSVPAPGDMQDIAAVSNDAVVYAGSAAVTMFTTATVSGRIGYAGFAPGPRVVLFCITNDAWSSGYSSTSSSNAYSVGGLYGEIYFVRAYVDVNNNGTRDWWEPYEAQATPLIPSVAVTSLDIRISDYDSDGDSMADWYEVWCSLEPLNPGDATLDRDGDGLSNAQEFQLRSWAHVRDTDGDHIDDGDEYSVYGTSCITNDTDGDSMPDDWELAHGLNLLVDDGAWDLDLDWVSNRIEWQEHFNPENGDSDSDGSGDYFALFGKGGARYAYDRLDRLVGVEYENGLSMAYVYDGNGNIRRQFYLGRDEDHDSLPDLWEFLNGLSVASADGSDGPSGDADQDGWSNLQEWQADSSPTNPAAAPNVYGATDLGVGDVMGGSTSLSYVMAVGQLDDTAAEEIAIAGATDPGSGTNSIIIVSQTHDGWSTQSVALGSMGVTSMCIGQLPSNGPPAICIGTTSAASNGAIVKVTQMGGQWHQQVVERSTGAVANVIGIRPQGDLVCTYEPMAGSPFALYSITPTRSGTVVRVLDSNATADVSGTVDIAGSSSSSTVVRVLKDGSVGFGGSVDQVIYDDFSDSVISNELWNVGGAVGEPTEDSYSIIESGSLTLTASWQRYDQNWAQAWAEAKLAWSNGLDGIRIHIAEARHTQGNTAYPAGAARVLVGGVEVYSCGPRRTENDVEVHLIKLGGCVYWRKRSGGLWSNWGMVANASPVRLEAWGAEGVEGNGAESGSCHLIVDSVTYHTPASLASMGVGTNDFVGSDACYYGAARRWYYKHPEVAWGEGRMLAHDLGGSLAPISSAAEYDWITNRFTGGMWIGAERRGAESAWHLEGAGWLTYSNWAAGEPGDSPDHTVAAIGLDGKWIADHPSSNRSALMVCSDAEYDLRNQLIAARSDVTLLSSPQWASCRPLSTTGAHSVVSSAVDDRNSSGTLDVGDDLLIDEYSLGSQEWARVRSYRIPVSEHAAASSCPLAFADYLGTGNAVLFTAAPDGRLWAWTPTNSQGALGCQVFSEKYLGRRWLQLGAYRGGVSGEGLVGLHTDPTNSADCSLVYWHPQARLWTPEMISQTPPRTRIMTEPSRGAGLSLVNVKVWDAEGNRSLPMLQYMHPVSSNWLDATVLTLDGLAYTCALTAESMPAGSTHSLVWDSGSDLGLTFTNNILLRARSIDITLWGEWSEPVMYRIEGSSDSDHDGMPDGWERSRGLDPLSSVGDHGAGTDPDGDGMPNGDEYMADTNPLDRDSLLAITSVHLDSLGLRLDWKGGTAVRQQIQVRSSLGGTGESWTSIHEVLPPTPGSNTVPIDAGQADAALFYRIKVER
jgi:YD repeat-containing protein